MKLLLEKRSDIFKKNEQYEIGIDSLEDAALAYQKAMSDFSSSELQYANTGRITLDSGEEYYISYNGRIWTGKYWEGKGGKAYNPEVKEVAINPLFVTA